MLSVFNSFGHIMAKIEIRDVLDELNQDLRQQLLTTGSVSYLMVNENSLKEETKGLKAELKFAEKCLTLLNEFKQFFNDVRDRFEDNLNSREKKRLAKLENGYQRMVEAIRRRNADSIDIEIKDSDEDFLQDFPNDSHDSEYLPDSQRSINPTKKLNRRLKKNHCMSKSVNENVYQCLECQMFFNRKTLMNMHLKNKHGIKSTLKELIEYQVKSESCEEHEIKIESEFGNSENPQQFDQNTSNDHSFVGQIENKEDNKETIGHSFVTIRTEFASETDFVNEVEVFDEKFEMPPIINEEIDLSLENHKNSIKNNKIFIKEHIVGKRKRKRSGERKTKTKPPKIFQCKDLECVKQRDYKSQELLERHIYFHHTFAKPLFRCEKCSFVTEMSKEAQEHRVIHQSRKPYFCPICHKGYPRIEAARDHIPLHSEQLGVKCRLKDCNQRFKNQSDMHRHYYRFHLDSSEKHHWPCDWPGCEFVARSKTNLKHHNYIHTGEKPYNCEWPNCGKNFRSEAAYSTHMRLHKNDQCYACVWPGCDFRTHDRGTLRFHRMKHERLPNESRQKTVKSFTSVKKPIEVTVKSPIKDRSPVKRKTKKPKRYESDSESADSEGLVWV